MEENKKSLGGDVRAEALASLAARKKSRFAEKKSASPKKKFAYSRKWRIVCINPSIPPPTVKKNFDKGRSSVKKRHSLETMKVFVMSGETT